MILTPQEYLSLALCGPKLNQWRCVPVRNNSRGFPQVNWRPDPSLALKALPATELSQQKELFKAEKPPWSSGPLCPCQMTQRINLIFPSFLLIFLLMFRPCACLTNIFTSRRARKGKTKQLVLLSHPLHFFSAK